MAHDEIRITVREPRGTARWILLFLGAFVVIGTGVTVAVLAGSGEGAGFVLLWGLGFAGIPAFILWRLRDEVAEADFVLDPYGIHSAHGRDELVAWEDVSSLDWQGTGTSVNEERLVRLEARHRDGSHTRVSSLGLRRSTGEVDHVEQQLGQALATLGLAGRILVDGRAPVVSDAVWDTPHEG